jgi:uncharacterized protein (TIGR02118 family)
MAKSRVLNIVATECSPENDVHFNRWYDEVHIPMLLKYEGLKKVTRYQIKDADGEKSRYLAIYEFDTKEALDAYSRSPEFKAAIEEMEDTLKKEPLFELKWAVAYEPLKTWEKE